MHNIGLWEGSSFGSRVNPLTGGYAMLGLSFSLWWGRLGTIATIVGGLVVVLDYVGEERLRGWGPKLRDKPLRKLLTKIKSGCLPGLIGLVALVLVSLQVDQLVGERTRELYRPTRRVGCSLHARCMVLNLVSDSSCWGRLRAFFREREAHTLERISFGITAIPIYVFVAVPVVNEAPNMLSFGITFVTVIVIMWLLARVADVAIFSLDPLVIRPIAWSLARETPGQPIRWAGFLMLLVGQLLDLLAS